MAQRLAAVGGRPTGFDYLRLALSTQVLTWHSIVTSYGPAAQAAAASGLNRAPSALIIPVFFCLSGFLVAGSLDRSRTIITFVGLRLLRIYPALIVAVLAATFVIGPSLTVEPLGRYFTSSQTWRYLAGATGAIAYELPGLFLTNPNPMRVNGQLWTVPFDLICYALTAALAVTGLMRRRRAFAIVALLIVCAVVAEYRLDAPTRHHNNVPGGFLIAYFLAGTAVYLFRDRLPWNHGLGVVALVVTIACLCFPGIGDLLAVPSAAYLTGWLGLFNPPRTRMLKGADFSYGVFIFGYLVQQCWMTLGPAVHHWYINLALTFPTVWLLAAVSWRYIEKPALRHRALLVRLEDLWLLHRHRFVDRAARLGRLRAPKRVS